MLLVVEGEHEPANHERHVREAERILVRLTQRLDRAHEVIAEESDRPAVERMRGIELRDVLVPDQLVRERVWVAAIAERPPSVRWGAKPRYEYRPRRPCSADSSRKAGPSKAARSLRKADTGVSVSSISRSTTGATLSAAAAIEHLEHVGEGHVPRAKEHGEVVEDVCRLFAHPFC